MVRNYVVFGELPPILGPERPVAEGLATHYLSEYGAHLPHGAAQVRRPHTTLVELSATPDVLPADRDQRSFGFLAH